MKSLSHFSLLLGITSVTARAAADYAGTVLADNPLAFYRLNDGAVPDVAWNSGNAGFAANGTYTGVLAHREPGALAGSGLAAARFDGAGGHVSVPFHAALNPPAASAFTVEAWVKPTIEGAGNAQCPLYNRHSAGNRQGWVFFQRPAAQGFNFRMYNGNGSTQSVDITGGTYTIGAWTHLAAVWSGSTATLYVNGVAVRNQTAGYVANTDAPFAVGAYGADTAGDNSFTGAIDEVAFYPAALTAPTLLAHYQNGITTPRTQQYTDLVLANAPALYLRLEEVGPQSSAAANRGTLGPVADALSFPGQKRGLPGALTGSMETATGYTAIDQQSCDGAVSTHVPFKPEFNTAAFTVEAWLQPTANGLGNAQCPLYNRKEGTVRTGWAFFQRASASGAGGGWNFRMYNGVDANRSIDLTSEDGYTLGQWYHVVATFDGTIGNLYVNGVLKKTQTVTGSYAPNADTVEFSAGGFPNGIENPFIGGIDEVALYPSALTAARILAHYQNGASAARTQPYESLVLNDGAAGYFPLNESPFLPAVNSGSLGTLAAAEYVNTINNATGPFSPPYTGFEPENSAANFAANSYIELGNPPGLNFAGTISVEAWITLNDPQPADARIVSHGANDTGTAEVSLRIANGNYEFGSLATRAVYSAAADITAHATVHLAGTWDGAAWNLYRNGALVATVPDAIGATIVANANWAIGARGRWKLAAGYPQSGQEAVFSGVIDEVAIYRQALAPARVAEHYIAGIAGAAPLQIARAGGVTTLTWSKGTLQESDLLGAFTDVTGAASPFAVPEGTSKKFYRLRF